MLAEAFFLSYLTFDFQELLPVKFWLGEETSNPLSFID